MSLDDNTRQEISELIESNSVVLFMKGTRQAPQCGFSATVVGILDSYLDDYQTLDVLSNPEIRDGIKTFSSWPTIPQLYVKGEFVGGCDIIKDLSSSGELFEALGVDPPPATQPTIQVTDAAAEPLRQAAEQHGGPDLFLHLTIDSSFKASLTMGPRGALDVEAESQGITILLDRFSASRADGVNIDVIDTPGGQGFKVDNPNAPQAGRMSVDELKSLIDGGERFEFLDVRTPEEVARASIAGSILLTESEAMRIEGLAKDTRLVFICHHGPRGDAACEHFIGRGFTNVWNVEGGIDAWSEKVDPSVPRY
jgi:monothiol glutaredoxin